MMKIPTTRRPATAARSRRTKSRGQSLVEFALVFPLFVLLLSAMVDFGMGLFTYMSVNNAVRDAGRFAATNCTTITCTDAVRARAVAASGNAIRSNEVTVACTKAAGGSVACTKNTSVPPTAQNGAKTGDTVTVTARFTYRMIWPLAYGNPITLTSTATFIAE
jgi:Flp pilus assembly protein TadG